MKKILTKLTVVLLCCCCLFQTEIKAQQTLVCNDVINMSLDVFSCEIDIASLDIQNVFLETPPGVSYDNLSLEVYKGNELIEETINASYANIPLTYVVTDNDTGNTCWGYLKVEDQLPPVAICYNDIVVAIGDDGTATLFVETIDDGSYDLCSDIEMEIRRMNSPFCIGDNDDSDFSDRVTFYCCEVGETVSVELAVNDPSGNLNTCIAEVQITGSTTVSSFVAPDDSVITCADNLMDLSFPLNDFAGTPVYRIIEDKAPLGSYGAEDDNNFMGYYGDNLACAASVIYVHDDNAFLTTCNAGSILRTFTVVSSSQGTIYNQNITVEAVDDEITIEFPLDTVVCNTASVVEEEPIISSNGCHLTVSTYEDVVFTDGNGNTNKILRTWTVIDWCTEETWTQVQTIDIDNSLCGNCVLACNDFINISLGFECEIDLSDASSLDMFLEGGTGQCPDANLELHLFETADDYTNGNFFLENILTKEHVGQTLFYEVADLNSGNVCWGSLMVEDKLAPVAVCLNGLSVELPNGTEAVEFWAEDLNAGSFDNCDANAIYFEIRRTSAQDCAGDVSNVYSESMMVYCCDVNTTIEVEMLVIDESGNSAYCITTIIVEGSDDCSCEDDCVWPGDTNSDGVANQFDLLNIGLAYGSTGDERSSTSSNWIGQNATDWNDTFVDNLNYKHADADGNGLVDVLDLFPLAAHWGSEHNFKDTEDQFINTLVKNDLQLYVEVDTFTSGSQVQLPIILENNETDLIEVYGIAFSINYEQDKVIANSATIDFSDSWLGTEGENIINISKDFWSEGRIDVALSRTDGMNITGQGRICALDIIIEDVIFLNFDSNGNELIDAIFTIDNIRLINQLGEEIPVSPSTTTSKIQDLNTSITPIAETNFEVYPNPVSDMVKINLDQLASADIEIIDMNGRMIQSVNGYNSNANIDISTLSSGVYIVQIKDGSNTYITKLIKN